MKSLKIFFLRLRAKTVFCLLNILKPASNVVVHIRGFAMKLDLGMYMGRLLFAYRQVYEQHELDYLADHLDKGDVCIDVGANQGIYTLLMAHTVGNNGRVIAFEPAEYQYKRLAENLALNNLKNVTPIKAALGSCAGTATLYHDKNDGGGALKVPGNPAGSCEQVTVTTLDEFCARQYIKHIDFIKVDVEGAELEFLKGAEQSILKSRPIILMEIGPDGLARFNAGPPDVMDFLARLSYGPYDLTDNMRKINPHEEFRRVTNVLFVPNVSADGTTL
jgi:FkbM family methyltransferase